MHTGRPGLGTPGTVGTRADIATLINRGLGAERSLVQIQSPRLIGWVGQAASGRDRDSRRPPRCGFWPGDRCCSCQDWRRRDRFLMGRSGSRLVARGCSCRAGLVAEASPLYEWTSGVEARRTAGIGERLCRCRSGFRAGRCFSGLPASPGSCHAGSLRSGAAGLARPAALGACREGRPRGRAVLARGRLSQAGFRGVLQWRAFALRRAGAGVS